MKWLQSGKPALLLAPMEGVTDAPMRALLSECGGFSHCVSEFVRISQHVASPGAFLKHVPELAAGARTPCGVPVQVQLLGGDPEKLARSAEAAVNAGAGAVDLNFGCPARTVNRHDGGASLLRFPQRIRDITAAVRGALPDHVPLSVKLRLGWDDARAIHDNAAMAAEGGASWITIHGRTRSQGYRPPADWLPIGAVRRALGIPVVANGEIWTLEDLRRCRDQTGCEHFMIGRGAVADPSLSRRLAAELGVHGIAAAEPLQPAHWPALLQRLLDFSEMFSQRPMHAPGRLKQWLKMRHQRFPDRWYAACKTLNSCAEIVAVLQQSRP